MKKSIETMWKQGFISEGELIAPKVNDLYNRKSQNLVGVYKEVVPMEHPSYPWAITPTSPRQIP